MGFHIRRTLFIPFASIALVGSTLLLVIESSVIKKLWLSQGPGLQNKSFNSHWVLHFPSPKAIKLFDLMLAADSLNCEIETGIIVPRGFISIESLLTLF